MTRQHWHIPTAQSFVPMWGRRFGSPYLLSPRRVDRVGAPCYTGAHRRSGRAGLRAQRWADTMSGAASKIVVEQASKLFQEGTVVAFRHLDLAVREHETLCIVGPSGCGKTTLLRSIAGLIPLSSGTIRIDGEPVHEPRAGVAVVFQH